MLRGENGCLFPVGRAPQCSAVGFGALRLGARVIMEPGRWEPCGLKAS